MTLPPGILRTPQGIYVLESDSHASRWFEEHRRLDIAVDEIGYFAHQIPAGGVVIDAGASLGDHTATYSQLVGGEGHVYAFEPNPLTFKVLALNMGNRSNVSCRNAALGAAAGTVKFTPAPNAGASCIDENGSVDTSVVMLDSLRLERLDFMHLDCEGFEPFVLMGARETLARCKPAMVLEVNKGALARYGNSAEKLYAQLNDLGYDWNEVVAWHNRDMEQRDIVCLPRK